MNRWIEFGKSLQRWLTVPPECPVVCELAATHVAALRQRHGRVEAWAARPLPGGALRPDSSGENFSDPKAVAQALEEVLSALGPAGRHCALIVPDLAARVMMLEFETLPAKPAEVAGLVRWRLARDVPFDLAGAQVSYEECPGPDGKKQVLVALMLRSTLRQYENLIEGMHLQVGQVTVSSLAMLGWLSPEADGAQALVQGRDGSLSIAVVERGSLRLFRDTPFPAEGDATRLFEKLYPSLVYFEDHWGRAVSQVWLAGLNGQSDELATRVREQAGCAADRLVASPDELPPSVLSGDAAGPELWPALGWLRG